MVTRNRKRSKMPHWEWELRMHAVDILDSMDDFCKNWQQRVLDMAAQTVCIALFGAAFFFGLGILELAISFYVHVVG